ncbi:MAG: TRAP transporter substrate-binding protein DctP [Dehalococcoidia bacterium]|nr:TRAP transporter substrate-binding protein DctP [Dehalococcoidia bacterium]
MVNRLLAILCLVTLAVALSVTGCTPAAPSEEATPSEEGTPAAPEQEVLNWKAQTLWDSGEKVYQAFVGWTERIGELTGGTLLIEPLPAGAICSYGEAFDAVRDGVFEVVGSTGGYEVGKDRSFELVANCGVFFETTMQRQTWFWHLGGVDLTRDLYESFDMYYVGPHGWGRESLVSKVPFRTLDDFKGVKMRTPEGFVSELFKRLGANTVTIPGSEVYTALSTGVVDAADWGSPSMNYVKGFNEVCDYYTLPGFHSAPAAGIAITLKNWNKLSDAQKAALEVATREYDTNQVMIAEYDDTVAIREMAALGVEGIAVDDDAMREIRKMTYDIWREYSTESDFGPSIVESQFDYLKQLGLYVD